MSTFKIRCGSCSRVLSVRADAAGKKVRCPDCQAVMVIPAKSAPPKPPAATPPSAPDPVSPVNTTSQATPNAQVVACTSCSTRLSVKVQPTAIVVSCPKCKTKLRIGGSASTPEKPNAPTNVPTAADRPVAASAPATKAESHVAALAQPDDPHQDVFGNVDLGQMSASADGALAGGPTAFPRPKAKPKGNGFHVVLKWINGHRWVTALVIMNALSLALTLFLGNPEFPLMMLLLAVPLIGLLFTPRFHLLKKISQSMGEQSANIGVGGVLLVVVGASFKGLSRINRNDNVDLSKLVDASSLPSLLIGLLIFAVCAGAFLFLWRSIGVVRVIAVGYSLIWTIAFPILVIKGIAGEYRTSSRSAHAPPVGFPHRPAFTTPESPVPSVPTPYVPRRQIPPPQFQDPYNPTPNQPASTVPPVGGLGETGRGTLTPSSVVRRTITIDLPSATSVVSPTTTIRSGMKLQACWARKWYWVTVVNANEDGTVKVNWDDWKTSTYDMLREDLVIADDQ